MQIDEQLSKDLKKAELRYISDSGTGITRKKQNDNFAYFDIHGQRIKNETVLDRIKQLAIPPAWSDVWICPSPSGYLQATGIDDSQRKQYLYHSEWTKICQANKFSKLLSFAEALPTIRKQVLKDMAGESLEREKIIATVIWLLGQTMIRIGNDEYVRENNSYGLTTLRSKHVRLRGGNVIFEFRGKSGIEHSVKVTHPKIVKILKECIELPGYELFQYLDDTGQRRTIDSSDVNEYLQKHTGENITAKDFRTWGATLLTAETLYESGPFVTEEGAKQHVSLAVKKAAKHLRNTIAVCRSYYIHPYVIETYKKNSLIPHFEEAYKEYEKEKTVLTKEEYATLTLLRTNA